MLNNRCNVSKGTHHKIRTRCVQELKKLINGQIDANVDELKGGMIVGWPQGPLLLKTLGHPYEVKTICMRDP